MPGLFPGVGCQPCCEPNRIHSSLQILLIRRGKNIIQPYNRTTANPLEYRFTTVHSMTIFFGGSVCSDDQATCVRRDFPFLKIICHIAESHLRWPSLYLPAVAASLSEASIIIKIWEPVLEAAVYDSGLMLNWGD
ncbi:unnamed protein product [Absidia cylindrospora]